MEFHLHRSILPLRSSHVTNFDLAVVAILASVVVALMMYAFRLVTQHEARRRSLLPPLDNTNPLSIMKESASPAVSVGIKQNPVIKKTTNGQDTVNFKGSNKKKLQPQMDSRQPEGAASSVSTLSQIHRDRTDTGMDDRLVHTAKSKRRRIKEYLHQIGRLRYEASLKDNACPLPPKIPLIIRDMTAKAEVEVPFIMPNARTRTHFENDEFEGDMLIKFKPEPEDPYYKPYFDNRKRNFEIQVQGRFKRSSEGYDMFIGMEIPEPVTFGMVVKALAKVCLSVINNTVKGVHYSFGSAEEMPHIVFPIEASLDRLVITKPGETPPPMGLQMFPETLSKRERECVVHTYIPQNIYSFSMHGMYIDFTRWQVCNLPGIRPISLRTFWGDQPVRLIAYQVKKGHTGPHLDIDRKMIFRFELDNIGDKIEAWESRCSAQPHAPVLRRVKEYEDVNVSTSVGVGGSDSGDSDSGSPSGVWNGSDGDESDVESEASVDAGMVVRGSERKTNSRTQIKPVQPSTRDLVAILHNKPALASVWISVYVVGFRRGGGLWFVINGIYESGMKVRAVRTAKSLRLVMTTYAEGVCDGSGVDLPKLTAAASPTQHANQDGKVQVKAYNKRNSISTNAHPLHAPLLRWMMEDYIPTAKVMDAKKEDFGVIFKPRIENETVIREGCVITANWETRWCESWAVLSSLQLCLYASSRRKPNWSINMQNVLSVSMSGPGPMDGYYFEIETVGRVYYLAVSSERERAVWLKCLENRLAMCRKVRDVFPPQTDPRDVFVVRSRRWGRERSILNMRNQIIASDQTKSKFLLGSTSNNTKIDRNDENIELVDAGVSAIKEPLALVSALLSDVLNLDSESPMTMLIAFLSKTAHLKLLTIDQISSLGHDEALSFWLNLYHCLLSHALLLIGPPNTARQIMTFYNDISYEIAEYAFSLGEIEHSILRAPLSNPAKLIQFIVPGNFLPHDERSKVVLSYPDPRINFALNWGASPSSTVPIYNPAQLDTQLDKASAQFLNLTVEIAPDKQRVTLPKICEWYPKDFDGSYPFTTTSTLTASIYERQDIQTRQSRATSAKSGVSLQQHKKTSKVDLLQYIARVASEPIKTQAKLIILSEKPVSYKYKKATWKFCRSLSAVV
eukprot:CFRG8600T1